MSSQSGSLRLSRSRDRYPCALLPPRAGLRKKRKEHRGQTLSHLLHYPPPLPQYDPHHRGVQETHHLSSSWRQLTLQMGWGPLTSMQEPSLKLTAGEDREAALGQARDRPGMGQEGLLAHITVKRTANPRWWVVEMSSCSGKPYQSQNV